MDLGHREPHGDRILLGWAVSILLLVHGANIFLVESKSEGTSLSTRRHSPGYYLLVNGIGDDL